MKTTKRTKSQIGSVKEGKNGKFSIRFGLNGMRIFQSGFKSERAARKWAKDYIKSVTQ